MSLYDIRAIVLAAGKSTRFKTKKSKLLFNICGRTMILYPVKVLEELNIPMTLVLGHQAEEIKNEIACVGVANVQSVIQEQPLGTGHAVACSQASWNDAENIMILYGDMPLVTRELFEQLITEHKESGATLTFLTAMMVDPRAYGRVIEKDGKYEIVEAKDCSPEQLEVKRINAGVYLINRAWLQENINHMPTSKVTGEIYLTELVKMAGDQGHIVHAIQVPYDSIRGVNTLQELWEVEQIKRSEFIRYCMANGVRFELAQGIHMDINVKIGAGSFIGTGVHLLGDTTIGENCWIGAFTIIEDTVIGDNTMIHSHTVVQDSIIGDDVHIGPFARLRNNVQVHNNAEVGNFVELKRTVIGEGAKAKHLSYLGDATVGESVNIGAGTVTCNFDGVGKHKTCIEEGAFVGSNSTLVAPIKIGKNAYTAAGSTLTQDVPPAALAIGRNRQENKTGYAEKLLAERDKVDGINVKPIHCDAAGKSETVRFNFKGALKTEADRTDSL